MNLIEALDSYGVQFKPHQSDPNEIWICCPFCAERNETPDTRYRLGVNVETGEAHCFNCEWGSRDADYTFGQLSEKLQLGELQAAAQRRKEKPKPQKISLPEDFVQINNKTKHSDIWSRKVFGYLIRRGVTPEQMKEKNIGFSMYGDYAYRVLFPVYYKSKLRGIVARDFTGKSKLKYKNSEGDKYIYNLPDEAQEKVVLAEGVFDALAIERGVDRDGYAAGAVLGHAIPEHQMKQLAPYKQVVLWPDPDRAGIDGFMKIGKQLQEAGKKVRVVLPDMTEGAENYDPSDVLPRQARGAVKNALPLTIGLEMRLRNWVASQE